jgi:hypothetical protein
MNRDVLAVECPVCIPTTFQQSVQALSYLILALGIVGLSIPRTVLILDMQPRRME